MRHIGKDCGIIPFLISVWPMNRYMIQSVTDWQLLAAVCWMINCWGAGIIKAYLQYLHANVVLLAQLGFLCLQCVLAFQALSRPGWLTSILSDQLTSGQLEAPRSEPTQTHWGHIWDRITQTTFGFGPICIVGLAKNNFIWTLRTERISMFICKLGRQLKKQSQVV